MDLGKSFAILKLKSFPPSFMFTLRLHKFRNMYVILSDKFPMMWGNIHHCLSVECCLLENLGASGIFKGCPIFTSCGFREVFA